MDHAAHGARILLVDDDPFMQRVTSRMLLDLGALVTLAGDGREAFEKVQAEPFDCILMDVQMPVLDGIQATRLIRACGLSGELPVIAVTGSLGEAERARCREAGMNDLLGKPVARAALQSALGCWLKGRQVSATAADRRVDAEAVPALFDLSALTSSIVGDPQRLARFVELFVSTMSESRDALCEARAVGDMDAMAHLAHRMKSSLRMVGAASLAARCESLESMSADGAVGPTASALADDIETGVTHLLGAMQPAARVDA